MGVVPLFFASFFVVISFLAAERPSEIESREKLIPDTWSAGVPNHGSYYEWYTIEEAPILFALGIFGLFSSFFIGAHLGEKLKNLKDSDDQKQ